MGVAVDCGGVCALWELPWAVGAAVDLGAAVGCGSSPGLQEQQGLGLSFWAGRNLGGGEIHTPNGCV